MQGAGKPQEFTAQAWTPPSSFDGYRKLSLLGRGGMGEVFLCHDSVLDRPVAVKFISVMDPDNKAREQFLTEARAAARLQHPNVVAVYRVGEVEGHPYIVSEYIRGDNLARLPKPVPWQEVLELGIGLTRGLAAAHRRGILHRDLKPSDGVLGFSRRRIGRGDGVRICCGWPGDRARARWNRRGFANESRAFRFTELPQFPALGEGLA